MDTHIYTKLNKYIYHSDVKNYPINNKIKSIMFDHLDYLYPLDSSGKARSYVLNNVERSLLCNSVYPNFDLVYDPDNDSIISFHHFDFNKLRFTFQFELLRLLKESMGPSFKPIVNQIYKKQDKGFYVYARTMKDDLKYNKETNSKNINGCVNYCMRYASRPAMAESSILMKCENCGYKEEVPVWILEELNEFSDDKTYQMCCPRCNHTMY